VERQRGIGGSWRKKEGKREKERISRARCVVEKWEETERKGERERERERESACPGRERDGALSHDRARCNARAAMHKQRRASRSAPAKVTRVMSRCPLCRTNSATRPKALSRVRSRAARRGRRDGKEETDRAILFPRSPSRTLSAPLSLPGPPRLAGIRY
jgi:hypothetical protein